jgi:hypothetical protein
MDNTQNNLPNEAEGKEEKKTAATEATPTSKEKSPSALEPEKPVEESKVETTSYTSAEAKDEKEETKAEPAVEKSVEATIAQEEKLSSTAVEKPVEATRDESAEAEAAEDSTKTKQAVAESANLVAKESKEAASHEPGSPETKEEVGASDEDLENDDDTAEVEADDDHEEALEEVEIPEYADYKAAALVEAAEKLMTKQPAHKLKDHFEPIRKNLMLQLNDERKEKLEEFKEQGGNELDFEYIQPLRERFKKVYGSYRLQRKKHYQELEEQLNANLSSKLALIEKLKELVTKEESIGKTFKEFNEITQAWRDTGAVPRAESHNLWQTWHHHVHIFYEYIDINKELRDLDYKKNRADKEALITKAEQLLEEKDLPKAFKALQDLHKQWKHVGPVEPENREPLWEKFSEFTKQLHDKRESYYEGLREKRDELISEKKKIVAQLEAIDINLDKHHQWQKAMKEVQAISGAFKKIGRLHHPENDAVWETYRQALRKFNHSKNQFYKNLKQEHQANLEKKRALLAKAVELKDSDDWRDTANALKKIQADWKTIGHVPHSESDKIWKQFRTACNHFFERLTENNKAKDQALEGNLNAKESLLKELQALELKASETKAAVAELKEFIGKWRAIGPVPRGKGKVEKAFNSELDVKFDAINLSRDESARLRFENKMKNLSDQGGSRSLKDERRGLQQILDEERKELGQLETNMSFFSSSNPNSPIVKEAQKKIEKQKEQIERTEAKVKMLNIEIRQVAAAQAKEEEKAGATNESTDKPE